MRDRPRLTPARLVSSLLLPVALLVIAGITPAVAAEDTRDVLLTGTTWTTDVDGDGTVGLSDIGIFACGFMTRTTCANVGSPPMPNCWCTGPNPNLEFDCVGEAAGLGEFAIMAESFLSGMIRTGKCP